MSDDGRKGEKGQIVSSLWWASASARTMPVISALDTRRAMYWAAARCATLVAKVVRNPFGDHLERQLLSFDFPVKSDDVKTIAGFNGRRGDRAGGERGKRLLELPGRLPRRDLAEIATVRSRRAR